MNDVDGLIAIDLLAYCKFSGEPYKGGFKYKLTCTIIQVYL